MELQRICPVCNKSFIITDEFTINWINESPNVISCCSNECAVNSMVMIEPVIPKTEQEIKQINEFNDFTRNLGKSRLRKIINNIKKLW